MQDGGSRHLEKLLSPKTDTLCTFWQRVESWADGAVTVLTAGTSTRQWLFAGRSSSSFPHHQQNDAEDDDGDDGGGYRDRQHHRRTHAAERTRQTTGRHGGRRRRIRRRRWVADQLRRLQRTCRIQTYRAALFGRLSSLISSLYGSQ